MSRHDLTPRDTGITVVVGWDPPLATYFAQVLRRDADEDEVILWIGTACGEVTDPEALRGLLARWADLDAATLAALRADRAGAGPATPLQRLLRTLWRPGGSSDRRDP